MSMTETQLIKARRAMAERLERERVDIEFKYALQKLVREAGNEKFLPRKLKLMLTNTEYEGLVTFVMDEENIAGGYLLQVWRGTDGVWRNFELQQNMTTGDINVVVDATALGRELGRDRARIGSHLETGHIATGFVEGVPVSFRLTRVVDDGSENDNELRVKTWVVDFVKREFGITFD